MTARSLRNTGSTRELWSWRALSRSELPDALGIFSPLVVQFEALLRKRLIESVAHEEKHPCEIETASSVGLVNRRLGLMYIYIIIYIYIYTIIYIVFYNLYNGVFTIRIFIIYWSQTDISLVLHGFVRAVEGVLKLCTSHSPVRNIREYWVHWHKTLRVPCVPCRCLPVDSDIFWVAVPSVKQVCLQNQQFRTHFDHLGSASL